MDDNWRNESCTDTVEKLKRKVLFEQRKVILFVHNATCYPKSATDLFSQIKTIFLPKNTTSRLQALDVGII